MTVERPAAWREPREAPHPTETALSVACMHRVRKMHGGEVLKVHGSGTQQSGQPDHIVCIRGRFVAIELKQPGKRPTPLQMKRLRSWAKAGALVGWATTEVEYEALLAHVDDPSWVNPQMLVAV